MNYSSQSSGCFTFLLPF